MRELGGGDKDEYDNVRKKWRINIMFLFFIFSQLKLYESGVVTALLSNKMKKYNNKLTNIIS